MGRVFIIEKGEIEIMEEKFKGATTGVDNGVPPEGVSAVKVADYKEGRRKTRKKGTKGIKVYRLGG